MRKVKCVKFGEELEGMDFPPFPGELGERIYENISKEAWKQWLGHQTTLINEYRLSSLDPKARQFLQEEMEKFLFTDEEVAQASGFVPVEE